MCPMTVRLWLLCRCGATIGPGARVFSGGTFVWGRLDIGADVMVAQDCRLYDYAPITIGDRAWVGPGSSFLTRTHVMGDRQQRAGAMADLPITVGQGCWLGGNVTVLAGVTIGDGCMVAAGAVITRDCDPNGLYAGVPAVRKRDLP
jgi:maltose O-acetyltransferase